MDTALDRSYLGGFERGEHNLALISLLKISEFFGGARVAPCSVLLVCSALTVYGIYLIINYASRVWVDAHANLPLPGKVVRRKAM